MPHLSESILCLTLTPLGPQHHFYFPIQTLPTLQCQKAFKYNQLAAVQWAAFHFLTNRVRSYLQCHCTSGFLIHNFQIFNKNMFSPKLCVCVLVVFECACVSRLYGSGSDDRTQLCSHSVEEGGGGFPVPLSSVQHPSCYLSCNSSHWGCSGMLSQPNTSSLSSILYVECCADGLHPVLSHFRTHNSLGVWGYGSTVVQNTQC